MRNRGVTKLQKIFSQAHEPQTMNFWSFEQKEHEIRTGREICLILGTERSWKNRSQKPFS